MYEAITIFCNESDTFLKSDHVPNDDVSLIGIYFFPILKITHRGVSRGLMCLLEPLIDGGARVVGALSTPLT